MDSKEEATAEGHRHISTTDNSGGSNTTVALQKKRARRVSFAEMTSVHFFDRDEEDNETPNAKAAKMDGVSANELDFGLELEQSKEIDGEDIDVEEMEMPRSFLRPLGSPSPGGSTIGSASSIDEDNFFGPVSTSFIRPGRLSGSATSDDIHDVTMDSTAFSMHYRSLARSESGGDLKTPTVGQLFFEDKTPMNVNVGSSMSFPSLKKLSPKSSSPISKLSVSHNSNDMSLVAENLDRYDYEKLSPGLDALLAESKKRLLFVTAPDYVTTLKSPKSAENESLFSLNHGDNILSLSNYARKEQGVTCSHDKPHRDVSDVSSKLDEACGIHGGFSPKKLSPNAFNVITRRISDYKTNPSLYQLSKDEYESPLVLSKFPVKQKMLLTAASPCKDLVTVSSSQEKPDPLLRNESTGHEDTKTPIQRSISKLELMEKSSFRSSFSARVDNNMIKNLEFVKSPLNKDTKNSTNTSKFANNLAGEEFRANSGTCSSSPGENLNEVNLQKMILTAASPCKDLVTVISLQENSDSLLRIESIGHEDTKTPTQRSISKLELMEKSSFCSSFSARMDNNMIKTLEFVKSPLNKGTKINTNTSKFANDLAGEEFRAISDGTGSSSSGENLHEISLMREGARSSDLETLKYPNDGDMETTISRERKHWTNIFSKFSEDVTQLIFGSDYEFNFKMFDVLGDLLVHLQKSKLYETLFNDATPKSTSVLHDLQFERVADTNIMFSQIVLEKAKLQLNHLKREMLLKRLQLLSSRIQDSQLIRRDLSSRSLEISTSDVRVHVSVYPGEGNGMWVVHSVDSMNHQHNIVLDYLGFVVQSIKVVVGPSPSTSFSLKANDTNLLKNFPNMGASKAVEFVFNAETECKYAGSKTLVREIQATSSLLGTLLDVFEEVQLSQIEFQNLTESSFCSPPVEQLVLKLCFYSFITGKKVILELDMRCLKRGIYPSEILPFQIALQPDVRKCSSSKSILDDIKDALESLKTGYMRIFRLCGCVSQVVQAASNA